MKTFLSIGTGPGIGLATAERFAGEGFRVILSARNETKTKKLAGQLEARGHKFSVRTVEAAEPSSVAALVSQVESEFAGIDVLHFNAASLRKATLADQPRETFNYDLAVNIGGAMVAAQAVAPTMIARGSGSILFTGGGFALQPHPDFLSLSIGKAGIRALAQGIFEAFRQKGVHVATVTVAGLVMNSKDANAVAEQFWRLHSQPIGSWQVEIAYMPTG
jgi:NAD(P)-dependent dehydrogenase (short-subunit alcohol dehydrogenase family)